MDLQLLIKGLPNKPIKLTKVTDIFIKKSSNDELVRLPLDETQQLQLNYQEYKFINKDTVVIVKGEDLKTIVAEL
ncbi:hypothetical protein [Streptococcus gallolyticus]|uniref:hypothetical protein n=1 Tax=Streptococcus gallolyticus TaxID=315405 RepID=UPI002098495F|nr:hypothetical protein [Streptococcus gallolyticus]MCO7177426.1 hypothetical protein [Streptococcus gallolyticus]MDO5793146.1 hypothetical protein [Turicibacter sp.]